MSDVLSPPPPPPPSCVVAACEVGVLDVDDVEEKIALENVVSCDEDLTLVIEDEEVVVVMMLVMELLADGVVVTVLLAGDDAIAPEGIVTGGGVYAEDNDAA